MKKYFSLYIFMLCGLLCATDAAALTYTCNSPGCDNLTISNTSEYNQLHINKGGIANNINFMTPTLRSYNQGTLNDSVVNGGYIEFQPGSVTNNLVFNSGRLYIGSDAKSII